MSRRPPVPHTALPYVPEVEVHPHGCACAEGACVGRAIQLDVDLARRITADAATVYDRPPPARCDDGDLLSLLRGPDDLKVAAARRGGAR